MLGFQGEKLGGTDAVMACAKHFAAYGAAIAGRDYNAVDMSEQQLWEVYLPPFKAAADAGVATFMNSFNTLNGIPATGNAYLQRDILKGQWQIPRLCGERLGLHRRDGALGLRHRQSRRRPKGPDRRLRHGHGKRRLPQAPWRNSVQDGKVNIALVDDAVRRILRKKFELGLFDDPYRFSDEKREKQVLSDPQHRAAARQMARKSMVLLKNENATLPLTAVSCAALPSSARWPKPSATSTAAGSWIPTPRASPRSTTACASAPAKPPRCSTPKAARCRATAAPASQQAVATAKAADVIVLTVGETWDMSGEAKSRTDIHLPGVQEELFQGPESHRQARGGGRFWLAGR